MRRSISIAVVTLSCLLMSWNLAGATVIDFESLYPYGGVSGITWYPYGTIPEGDTYHEDGYTLKNNSSTFYGFTDQTFGWWSILDTDHYAGSLGLFVNYWPLTTTLTKDDGSPFDLYSIDLSRIGFLNQYGGPGIRNVDFTGIKSDNSVVTQTFTYSDALAFQTFFFSSDFTDLKSASWVAASRTDPTKLQYFQFDNITMYPLDPLSQVPEPATVLLLGLGLAGLAGIKRRFKD